MIILIHFTICLKNIIISQYINIVYNTGCEDKLCEITEQEKSH